MVKLNYEHLPIQSVDDQRNNPFDSGRVYGVVLNQELNQRVEDNDNV